MRFLLDTHALIWWWMDDPILPMTARSVMMEADNSIFVSAATAWEIATKVRKGRLPEIRDRVPGYRDHITHDGFLHIAITTEHGLHGGSLPGPHRDPFDRVIAAQALVENMTVITRDPAIAAFGCKVLW